MEKGINLFFDKFSFSVSYSMLEEFITNELKRLSEETGYGIENLKIEFRDNNDDSTVAYFHHRGDHPVGFCFHLNKFNDTSPNKIIDVCRHEFAHFVVCMQNVPGTSLKRRTILNGKMYAISWEQFLQRICIKSAQDI